MNIYQFSKNLNQLKYNQEYTELLNIFNKYYKNYSKQEIKDNIYIITNVLTALRKTDQSSVALKFLNQFNIQLTTADERIVTAYGWCVWDLLKQGIVPNEFLLFLKQLTQFKSKYTLTLLNQIFNAVVQIENIKVDFLNEILDNILVNLLDKKEVVYNNKTFASNFEKWYAMKSKLLFSLERYQDSIEISKKALEVIKKFHNNNDIWFVRRIALCNKKLGNLDEALEDLNSVYRKKRDWFILFEIAQIYVEKQDFNNGYNLLVEVLNIKLSMEFKVKVIYIFAQIIEITNVELANKHYCLIKKIYETNGWKLKNNIEKFQCSNIDFNNLKYELINFWKNEYKKLNPSLIGCIKKIIHNNNRGKVGFIEYEGKDYYFSIPLKHKLTQDIEVGRYVYFTIDKDRIKIIGIKKSSK